MYSIEELHSIGYLPDRYYYQSNGKNAQENYMTIKRQRAERYKNLLQPSFDNALEKAVDKALEDIFKGFKPC